MPYTSGYMCYMYSTCYIADDILIAVYDIILSADTVQTGLKMLNVPLWVTKTSCYAGMYTLDMLCQSACPRINGSTVNTGLGKLTPSKSWSNVYALFRQ